MDKERIAASLRRHEGKKLKVYYCPAGKLTIGYGRNVEDLNAARDFAVGAAEEMVQAAQAQLDATRQLIPGYAAKELQARLNYERQKDLFEKGVKPAKEVEIMKEEWRLPHKATVRNLNFYYGAVHALKNINLDIADKRVTA